MESDSHSIHLYELNWNKTFHHRCHCWSFGAMKIRSALLKATVQTSGTGELSQTTQDVTSEHSNCVYGLQEPRRRMEEIMATGVQPPGATCCLSLLGRHRVTCRLTSSNSYINWYSCLFYLVLSMLYLKLYCIL